MNCNPASRDVPEKMLLRGVKEGDEDLFEQLVARYNKLVLSIVLRLTQNITEAEDVVQEVFWRVHRRIATYDPARPFVPWLCRITLNSAYTHLRRRAARRESSIEELQPRVFSGCVTVPWESSVAPDVEERLGRQEMARRAEEIIAGLPEEYGTVLWLHYVEDISVVRVSEALNLSLPAVKSRLYRGRLAVRELLQESLKMDRDSQTHVAQVPTKRGTRRHPVWRSQRRLDRGRTRRPSRSPSAPSGTFSREFATHHPADTVKRFSLQPLSSGGSSL